MEQILDGYSTFIWSLAGTAVLALCAFIASKAKKFFQEHAANNHVAAEHGELKSTVQKLVEQLEVTQTGVCCILRAMMVDEHKRLVHQHYATPDEKEHFEEMHKAYHAMGGNGTGTSLYTDVMQMYSIAPSERSTNEHKDS